MILYSLQSPWERQSPGLSFGCVRLTSQESKLALLLSVVFVFRSSETCCYLGETGVGRGVLFAGLDIGEAEFSYGSAWPLESGKD